MKSSDIKIKFNVGYLLLMTSLYNETIIVTIDPTFNRDGRNVRNDRAAATAHYD